MITWTTKKTKTLYPNKTTKRNKWKVTDDYTCPNVQAQRFKVQSSKEIILTMLGMFRIAGMYIMARMWKALSSIFKRPWHWAIKVGNLGQVYRVLSVPMLKVQLSAEDERSIRN